MVTTLRYAASLLAAIALWCLSQTPNSPATIILAGFFILCFGVVCMTCREHTDHEIRRQP